MDNYYEQMKEQFTKETGMPYLTGSVAYAAWLQVKLLEEQIKEIKELNKKIDSLIDGSHQIHIK